MTPFQTSHLRLEALDAATAVLWLDVAGRPVNVFNAAVMADLDEALSVLAAESACKVLLIRSAKPSGFIAGADLHEFAAVGSPAEAMALSEKGQRLFDKLAALQQATMAVIGGPCLGGGLELALACDYRLVSDQSKTQLGLPEIELGLLPGWGGTQRLPRVIGLEPALRIILGRKRLNAREAFQWGLADTWATSDAELPVAIQSLTERARHEGKRPKRGLPLRNWRQRLLESNSLGRGLIYGRTEHFLHQRVPDDMPAPFEALEAVRVGLKQGMPAGLAREREGIGRLATTPACRNLVSLFFQHEKAKKLPAELRRDDVQPVRRVGIVGAGTMGAGIAQLASLKGFEVVVQEVNDAALAAGVQKIEALFAKAVAHRLLPADDAAKKLAAISRTTSWQGFDSVDLVVEAVIEDLDAKRAVFRGLEQRTRPATLLATNTSSLLVERLQEGRDRPQRIGGLHFFNPVHKMPLVEVVRAPATDDATTATLAQWAIDLGKTTVVVKDSPGFLVNRILMPYLNEAALLLADGWRVDRLDGLMRRFGMPVGPLELLDQVGLDVAAHIAQAVRPVVAERIPVSPLFATMNERRWLGEKAGVGFYRYKAGKKTRNRDLIFAMPKDAVLDDLDGLEKASDKVRREALDRLVLPMVNEAAMCLGEGIVASAEQLDLAMVFGTGWAPHRGGPLRYADDRGLRDLVTLLASLSKVHGPRFEPCAELRRRAEAGETFYPPARSASDGTTRPSLALRAGQA